MAISATDVKALRDKTGAGMMDCKAALAETGGDMEAAIDWLRAKGVVKAAKKAGRIAAEGLIGIAGEPGRAAVVEVNSETDFVARNDSFQALVRGVADAALHTSGAHEAVASSPFPGKGHHVEDEVKAMVATIGENVSFRRAAVLAASPGVVANYIHAATAEGLGRIGVLVALQSTGDPAALNALGRQIAMHIAAANPLALRAEDIDPATIARERAIFAQQARESGKPESIIDKMVDGRMRKFFEESTLLKQPFVIDPDKTVEGAVKAVETSIGAPIVVTAFERFALGEGIEKAETDFAAEVAAAAGK